MATTIVTYPSSSSAASAVQFNLNSVATTVNKDTVTPANNIPLPVQLLDTSGNLNTVTVGSSVLPTGGATSALQTSGNSTLTAISGQIPAALGQTNAAGSLSVVLASNQGAVPVSQSGTWNITNISGTISLPTGAATETTLSTLNGKVPSGLTVSSTRLLVDGSGVTQPISAASLPLPTGAATDSTLSTLSGKFGSLGQKTSAGSAPVVLASDQSAIPVSQSGTWNINNVSGTVSLPTGAATQATLSTLNSKTSGALVPTAFDEIVLTYVPSGNGVGQIATAVYKLASVTQKTLTMTYDASNRLTDVVAT